MTDRQALTASSRTAMQDARGRCCRSAREVLAAMVGRAAPILAAALFLAMGGLDRPAQAQMTDETAILTIAAGSNTYGYQIDDIVFSVTRSGMSDSEINGSVTMTQDHTYLPAGSLSWSFTIPANENTASHTLLRSAFSGGATQTGDLIATLDAGSDYEVGTPGAATVEMVVLDPAITVRPEQAAYSFDEDDSAASVAFVARTAPGLPRPNAPFNVSVASFAREDGAESPGDYAVVAKLITFASDDFTASGSEWQARKEVALSIVDDGVAEGDEAFDLRLGRTSLLPRRIKLLQADGSVCPDEGCPTAVTLSDPPEDPVLTIAAGSDTYGYQIDDVVFTVTRTGTTEEETSGSVTLSQDRTYLPAGRLSWTFSIPANETAVSHTLLASAFSGGATQTGDLTATLDAGDGYEVGTPGAATVEMVVLDPAITVRPEKAAYGFAEDDAAASVVFIARTAPGLPRPNADIVASVSSRAREDGATPPVDFAAVSQHVTFAPDDFVAAGSEWEARKEVALTLVDDGEDEGDEIFDLKLEMAAALPQRIKLRQADGTACPDEGCLTPVTLSDPGEVNTPATGKPTISGVPQAGETLTADTGDIEDNDGVPGSAGDFTYQWVRVEADGTSNPVDVGTDSSTYEPVEADVGKRIRVQVSFTDGGDNAEGPLESEAYPAGTETIAARYEGPEPNGLAITPVPPAASAEHGPYYTKDDFLALPDGAVHGRGARLTFTLTLDTEVIVTGAPELVLDIFDRERRARYTGGSGTRALTFVWTVAKGDNDPDGLGFVSLDLNGGTIRDGQDHDFDPASLAPRVFAEHRVRGGLFAMRLEATGSAREGEPFEFRVIRNGGYDEVAVAGVGVADSFLPLVKPSYHHAVNGPGRRQMDFDHGAASEPGVRVSTRTMTPPGDGIADASRTLTIRLTGTDAGFHLTPPLGDYRAWYLAEGPLEVTVPVIDTGQPLAEAGLRVHPASAREAPGAKLVFRVTLSPHSEAPVTVDYRTGDDPYNEPKAVPGSDYVEASDSLTFAPGETQKTVEVEVLADDHDEQYETMRLFLENAQGARIDTDSALGVIKNDGLIPRAWLGRFGRAVGEQVLGAVESRMRATRQPGVEVTLAGQRVGGQAPQEVAGTASVPAWRERAGFGSLGSRAVTQGELLSGTSFAVTAETGGGAYVSLWGRGAVTRFEGREGDLSLDGEVASAMVGVDWAREAWSAGLITSRSVGEGSYAGNSGGRVESTLTGLYPWGRLALSEQTDVWGAAGYGTGDLSVIPKKPGTDEDGTTLHTDLSLRMAAVGLRGELLDGSEDGPTLTAKTDALIVQTASDAARGPDGGNLAAARATVTRLRLALEGLQAIPLEGGASLTPSFEIGVRHDGGDAETGFGVDFGGGIAWSDPESGLRAELRGRGLLTHEANGFRERSVSSSLAWDPRPSSALGPAATLTQTVGDPASGGADALLAQGALTGLAAQPSSESDGDGDRQPRRLEARFGYGFPAWGGRFASVPEVGLGLTDTGQEYILGWRLASDGPGALQLSAEARRIESNVSGPAEHRIGARLSARW